MLQGVSFHVEPRQTVAFVGSTGSGKSTILSLICRNYEFQKGEILIDGIDIRKIKISSLRRHFGQMLQDVFLFSGTIRSNIVLREENIPDEEIMKSAGMSMPTTSSTNSSTASTKKSGSAAITSQRASASCSALPAPSCISPAS